MVLNLLLICSLLVGDICLAVITTCQFTSVLGTFLGEGVSLAESFLHQAEHSSLMHREAADAILKYDDDGRCRCFLLQPFIWPSEISRRKEF